MLFSGSEIFFRSRKPLLPNSLSLTTYVSSVFGCIDLLSVSVVPRSEKPNPKFDPDPVVFR